MMKLLKQIFITLFALAAAGIGYITFRFNTLAVETIVLSPNSKNLTYFYETYEECRSNFRKAAQNIIKSHENGQVAWLNLESQQTTDLTIDYCYLPAKNKTEKLIIIISGIHGVEGYTGSAVQQMVLKEIVTQTDFERLGILFIHGLNPYGFKFKRRVTENNVDLNRNCYAGFHGYNSVNKGYTLLNSWLNKKGELNMTQFDQFFFPFYAAQKLAVSSKKVLRQAILQGQYQYETGIYFGGKELESNIEVVTPLVREIAEPYDTVLAIDLHTGYGQRGSLHLFSMTPESIKDKERMQSLFKEYPIDWGDTKDFYSVNGEFLKYLEFILTDKLFVAMPFEFGTLDTKSIFGSMRALNNLMIENQGYLYGYATERDRKIATKRFVEGFYPSSEMWRSKAIEDSRKLFSYTIRQYLTVDLE